MQLTLMQYHNMTQPVTKKIESLAAKSAKAKTQKTKAKLLAEAQALAPKVAMSPDDIQFLFAFYQGI